MNIVYEETKKSLMHGSSAVVLTIVKTEGSSPAKVGACMLVCQNGKTYGTIGGGNLEKYCTDMALDVYKTKTSFTKKFELDETKEHDVAMICGGNVTVDFTFFSYDTDPKVLNAFFKVDEKPKRALIFGGGHVGQALCPVLASINFEVIVLDDRPEFANMEKTPSATETIVCNYSEVSKSIEITKDDYVIIMTHGHIGDRDVLLQTCRINPFYIGCIGSRKKVEATKQYLRENGITEDVIEKVHSPIGLPIGGDSPAEIAISVAAQIIQCSYS